MGGAQQAVLARGHHDVLRDGHHARDRVLLPHVLVAVQPELLPVEQVQAALGRARQQLGLGAEQPEAGQLRVVVF